MGHRAKFIEQRNLPYADGVALQRTLLSLVADDPESPGAVVFAEHRPVLNVFR